MHLYKIFALSALVLHLAFNFNNINISKLPPVDPDSQTQTVELHFCGDNNTFNDKRCATVPFEAEYDGKKLDISSIGVLLDIPYYNQGTFKNRDKNGKNCQNNCKYIIAAAGCAPVVFLWSQA